MVVGEQASWRGTLHSPTATSHRSGCTSDCYCSSLITDGRIEWMFRRFPAIGCLLNKLIPRLKFLILHPLFPVTFLCRFVYTALALCIYLVLVTTCFHSTTPRTWQSQLPIPICSAFANTSSPPTVQLYHSHAHPSSQQRALHTSLHHHCWILVSSRFLSAQRSLDV